MNVKSNAHAVLEETFAVFRTSIQKEAFQTATQLTEDSSDQTLNIKSLTGFRGIYRVVVLRNYRMIFSMDNENVYLLRIGHHREIYRNLEF